MTKEPPDNLGAHLKLYLVISKTQYLLRKILKLQKTMATTKHQPLIMLQYMQNQSHTTFVSVVFECGLALLS